MLPTFDIDPISQKRGLVPSISYDGEIITESAVVAQFLADAYPTHLLPPSAPASNALYRARLAFFVDTFITKALPHIFAGQRAQSEAEKDAAAEELVAAIAKELEPLFSWAEDKGPFFGGSERLTLAEVSPSRWLTRATFFRLLLFLDTKLISINRYRFKPDLSSFASRP